MIDGVHAGVNDVLEDVCIDVVNDGLKSLVDEGVYFGVDVGERVERNSAWMMTKSNGTRGGTHTGLEYSND